MVMAVTEDKVTEDTVMENTVMESMISRNRPYIKNHSLRFR